MKKLVVIDPGFKHLNSHHQAANQSIVAACRDHEIDTEIYASNKMDPKLAIEFAQDLGAVTPYFETHCYPPNPHDMDYDRYIYMAEEVAEDIAALIAQDRISGDDTIVVHTAYSFIYYGVALALYRHGSALTGQLLLSMMFNPGAKLAGEQQTVFNRIELIRYQHFLKLLEIIDSSTTLDIELAAPSKSYAETYQKLWQHKSIPVHSAICYRPLLQTNTAPRERIQVLLYLGCPKFDKGFLFSVRWAVEAIPKFSDIDFVLHYNDEFPTAEDFGDVMVTLETLSQHDNFTLVKGVLSDNEYDDIIASTDVFFLLYDPKGYEFKTSGIFWDALRGSTHKGFMVSGNTWCNDELNELGLNHTASTFGDLNETNLQFNNLLHELANPRPSTALNAYYLETLLSSFGDWLLSKY